ncbi:MAG: hypothetical protein WAQ57_00780 [Candidatus Saccharimonadales bacterium]
MTSLHSKYFAGWEDINWETPFTWDVIITVIVVTVLAQIGLMFYGLNYLAANKKSQYVKKRALRISVVLSAIMIVSTIFLTIYIDMQNFRGMPYFYQILVSYAVLQSTLFLVVIARPKNPSYVKTRK